MRRSLQRLGKPISTHASRLHIIQLKDAVFDLISEPVILHQQVPHELQDSTKSEITQMHEEPAVNRQGTSDSDMILQMPGSFHFPTSKKKREGADESEGWTHLLQKLHLRT